jgi:NAD(P)-dependent dehydrogenase (short-subunit alcohol dehydrogenase family)
VYAGARKQKDLAALNEIENVESIRLDVTSQNEIDTAVERIAEAGRGLYGLVNNAGVSNYEALIEVEEDTLDFLFDVNVYGPYRVTKSFIPLIIEEQGRVTNISSRAGIMSPPILGVYSMSKHAIESYSDTLSAELARLGVKVSVVEPGNYRSAISSSAVAYMDRGDDKSPWAAERQARIDNQARANYEEPDDVAEAVFRALSDEKPKTRYMVVPNQGEAEATIRKAIDEMVQLNHDQKYSYDRQALVGMLDEALAGLDK